MHLRTLFAVSNLAAVVFAWLAIAQSTAAEIPDVPGWELTWHDEFDGPNVDVAKWDRINLRNSHNNEKQYYRPEQASIVDGNLRITATNEPLQDKDYRSARLESWQTFGPGRFEARIDLPTTQGMWPAFWLHPRAVQWPTGGEIDILENRGSQPLLVSSAYHWQTDPSVPCCSQHQYVFEEYTANEGGNPVNFHEGFHVYAVEWEATQLRFYVDGVLKCTDTTASYTCSWDTTAAPNGAHTLTTKAYDTWNNMGPSAAVSVTVSNPTGPPELVVNGGFETTPAPWSFSGAASWASGQYAHTGASYALLGNVNNASGTVSQSLTIPATAPATLTFWLSVTSNEAPRAANDILYVEVVSGAGATAVGTFSNLQRGKAGLYALKSFDLGAWRGQTVTLRFRATTNATKPTTFYVDDVSLR